MRKIPAFDTEGNEIGCFHFSTGETLGPILIYGTKYFVLYFDPDRYVQYVPIWRELLYTGQPKDSST